MSQKEVDRAFVLAKVKDQRITLKQAAQELALSYPQTKRLWSRYKQEGCKGLISRKRGSTSNRAVPSTKRKEISQIILNNYRDCKPLFITEKLSQYHNIHYSSEFIRKLMIEYHLWRPNDKKRKIHRSRQRRAAEGELLQADASDHDWFEGRGPRCHLHLFIDDATSHIPGAWFSLEETTEGYYRALKPVLEQKGRPVSLYTDKRSTFVVNQGNKRGKTQFARAMEELGIQMITAHSPQAKGRVERAFRTLQERLIWEMRIHHICTIEQANAFLPKFLEQHNLKYAKGALSSYDAYRPLNQATALEHILSIKEERSVSKNLETQYKNQIYQLIPPKGDKINLSQSKVTAITTLDKELIFEYQGYKLEYIRHNELAYQKPAVYMEHLHNNWKSKYRPKPSKHHPWRKKASTCTT